MSKIEVNAIEPQCGTTLTLGASGDTVALASGASQSGFGRTGTVDWDTTPKTATFTAVSGDGFFCNTTSSAFTCNLPAGTAGSIVSLADYAATWNTNNLTVSPNGSDKIGGVNADIDLNTEGQSVTFVFVDSTQGWVNVQDSTSNERGNAFITATGGTESTSGNFKIHKFTGPGTFTVTCAGTPDQRVDYLVVAGGGGGGGMTEASTPAGVGLGGIGGSGVIIVAESKFNVSSTSMTLISDTFTASSTPTTARIVVFAELPDGLSDFSFSATRDNTTFDAITLTDTGYISGSSGTKIYTGSTPLTGTASPQVRLRWKIVGSSLEGTNKIHGVSLQWK